MIANNREKNSFSHGANNMREKKNKERKKEKEKKKEKEREKTLE